MSGRWKLVLLAGWILPFLAPWAAVGQAVVPSATVTLKCFDDDDQPLTDDLLYVVFRGAGAGVHKRGVLKGGEGSIELSFGKPVSMVVRGRDRTFVPYTILPTALNEKAPKITLTPVMSRGVNSLEARQRVEIAARMAKESAPDSDEAKELENWAKEASTVKTRRKRLPLERRDEAALENCLRIVRGCQIDNGAFVMKRLGAGPDAPVWIPPYFANHAALALLAAHDRKSNPADLARVQRWLEWSAAYQTKDGFWYDFEGISATHSSNGKVDAWDSSAAMYLSALARFRRAGGKVVGPMLEAANRAVKCIDAVTDPRDGLTWAKPDYRVKFLMDNVETRAGLAAAAVLFEKTGDMARSRDCKARAAKIETGLARYWKSDQKLFAFALHENGQFEIKLESPYPHGLAQLFGVAFVAPEADAFVRVEKTFKPDAGELGTSGPERWLLAASKLDVDREKFWRAAVVKAAADFTPENVYLYRPAIAALGLLEGADWLTGEP
jgi:hypothetical protein